MQAFEAAARHLSFTRAADELNRTQGAISQQIRLLETRLNTQLFLRNAHSLELSAAGQLLFQPIRTLLFQMEHIVNSAKELANDDELVVYAPSCMGAKWLMPRIKEFRRRYSKIQLYLNIGESLPEMASREKSVAISIGEDTRSKNTRQEYLQSDSIFPVCSPILLPPGASFRHINDLKMFELLDVSGPNRDGVGSDWMSWLSLCGEGERVRKPTLRFGNSLLAVQAAIAGSGIALARGLVAESDLLSGSLVKPFDLEVSSEDPYYLVYPKAFENCEQVVCFREWLFDNMNSKNGT